MQCLQSFWIIDLNVFGINDKLDLILGDLQ